MKTLDGYDDVGFYRYWMIMKTIQSLIREGERESEGETDRQSERGREGDRNRGRKRKTERGRQRQTERLSMRLSSLQVSFTT